MDATLTKLIEHYLPRATAGDEQAAIIVIRCVELQARLQGM